MTKTLYLTIKKKYFDLIAANRKKVEYRRYCQFYHERLNQSYDVVKFVNGRRANSPYVIIEFKGVRKYRDRYLIYLGNVLEINDGKPIGTRQKTKANRIKATTRRAQ